MGFVVQLLDGADTLYETGREIEILSGVSNDLTLQMTHNGVSNPSAPPYYAEPQVVVTLQGSLDGEDWVYLASTSRGALASTNDYPVSPASSTMVKRGKVKYIRALVSTKDGVVGPTDFGINAWVSVGDIS
jgi:hypothetical protein